MKRKLFTAIAIAFLSINMFLFQNAQLVNQDIEFKVSPLLNTNYTKKEFKTLTDLQTYLDTKKGCLNGGAKIRLARGSYLRGSLKIKDHFCQNASGIVEITDYGTATTPAYILSSVRPDSLNLTWQQTQAPFVNGQRVNHLNGKRLFKLGPIPSGFKNVRQLYFNSVRKQIAVYPDKFDSNPSFLNIRHSLDCNYNESARSCLDLYSSANIGPLSYGVSPELEVVARVTDWNYEKANVLAYHPTAKRLTLASSLRTSVGANRLPEKDFGFYLRGGVQLISQPGEWAYSQSDRTIYYLAAANETPNVMGTELVFGTNETGKSTGVLNIDLSSAPNVDLKISKISLFHSSGNGLRISNARNVFIDGITSYGNEASGLRLFKLSGDFEIKNSRLLSNANDGMVISTVSGDVKILNNKEILKNGLLANQEEFGIQLNGISVGPAKSIKIEGNVIKEVGFAGISTSTGAHSISIRNNHIDKFCMTTNDCSGIYINGKNKLRFDHQNIVGNKVESGIGFFSGTPKNEHSAKAIYLDHAASGFNVVDNVMLNIKSTNGAIFVHAGNRNQIYKNKIYTTYGPAIGLMYNSSACPSKNARPYPMDDNKIFDNLLSAENSDKQNVYLIDNMHNRPQQIARIWSNNFVKGGRDFLANGINKPVGTECNYVPSSN